MSVPTSWIVSMLSSRLPSLGVASVTITVARPVDGDRPLVARPVLARDDLALVAQERVLWGSGCAELVLDGVRGPAGA